MIKPGHIQHLLKTYRDDDGKPLWMHIPPGRLVRHLTHAMNQMLETQDTLVGLDIQIAELVADRQKVKDACPHTFKDYHSTGFSVCAACGLKTPNPMV